MNVGQAIWDLEENGSSRDPIFYGDWETTPDWLRSEIYLSRLASSVRIGYYGGPDHHLVKHGTLSGMVQDRRKTRVARERPVAATCEESLEEARVENRMLALSITDLSEERDLLEDDLKRLVTHPPGWKDSGRDRWALVAEALRRGYTYAVDLCKKFDVDPFATYEDEKR